MKKTISFILSIVLIMTSVNCFAQEAQDNAKNECEVMKILTGNEKEERDMIDEIFDTMNNSSRVLIKGLKYSIIFLCKNMYLVCGEILGIAFGLSKVLLRWLVALCLYVVRLPLEFYSKNLSKDVINVKKLKEMYNSLPEEAQEKIKALIDKKDAVDLESSQCSCIIGNILKGKSFSDSESYCLKN